LPSGFAHLKGLELIAALRSDQLRRWQHGQRFPAEAYLAEVPALQADPELAIDLIFSEFALRRDLLRETPSLDEYLARFPQHSAALRQQYLLESLWQRNTPPEASEWSGPEGGSPTEPDHLPSLSRYTVRGELGRGGMGRVLEAHDPHLGRDLAIKLLREDFRSQPDLVRRFLNEARVCGRLQHPGVVPVYELGELPDGRPYFTMKLVRGRTLAALLAERTDPGQQLPRLLPIFEQVCQTLAYAHAQGVIHRDLKPANVMVGAFGEVQVMDWGLAKVLTPAPSAPADPAFSTCDEAPADPCAWLGTQSGRALGTLPYMPPEQARGEVERMDARSDVFGLGAILCEVLTGRPPYAGRDGEALLARARACDHAEALARLEGCGADAELVRLVRACLAAEPCDRPRDAGVVAAEVTAYLAGMQERLRTAELERAVNEDLARVTELLQTWKLAAAEAAMTRAEGRLADDGPAELRRRVRQIRDDLTLVGRLDRIRLSAGAVVDGEFDFASADRDYAALFREQVLAAEGEAAEVVAARLRGSAIRAQLVAALDDWAAATEDSLRRAWLLTAARLAQPGAWSDSFRDPAVWETPAALEELAREADVGTLSPQLLTALGRALTRNKASPLPFLTAAQARHPDDFWLNFLLGNALFNAQPGDAVGYYRAALAVRPGTSAVCNNLGAALWAGGRLGEAVAEFHKAIALDPLLARAHYNLGEALRAESRPDEAIPAYQRAAALAPRDARAHYALGLVLYETGRTGEAVEAYRHAVALVPRDSGGHNNLGLALQAAGMLDDAIEEYRRAVALAPNDPQAHTNLGNALRAKGPLDEAIAECRTAVALAPGYAPAHNNLGNTLRARGGLDEAVAEFRQAIALDPGLALAHYNLGLALWARGELDAAIEEYRRALALAPTLALAHTNLGLALQTRGRLDEAIQEHQKAVALDPTDAKAHGALGEALLRRGRFADAGEATRRCLELQSAEGPVRQLAAAQLQECQKLLALDNKLSAILQGEAQPDGADERLALAALCQTHKRRYAVSAYFYAGAFAEQPELADDLRKAHRYNAARASALAGCGRGADAKLLSDGAAQVFRRQALEWLRADLVAWAAQSDRTAVQQAMGHWRKDAALSGVRDPESLTALPAAERQQWQQFWDDVVAQVERH
jgi:serine/threonine-protein kinase